MSLSTIADKNLAALTKAVYPGRGIIIGKTKNNELVQVYWIMGRSSNSRNRIFVKEENGFVKTKAFDEKKLEDPSLIIYYPIKQIKDHHIVTNGDQTDTIYQALEKGLGFESAINQRTFEPDPPNLTPRISGIVYPDGSPNQYSLSIIKSIDNNDEYCARFFFNYSKAISGFGHCITTYVDDGNPLPSYAGEPMLLPLEEKGKILEQYWKTLDNEHLISMVVKVIDQKSGISEISIRNKLS